MTRNAGLVGLARAVVVTARDQQLSFLAAAIAYYAFVSLVPLVVLALAIATLVWGGLTSTSGRGGATVLGVVVLLWSSLRLFRGLDIAFSRVYGAVESVSLVEQVTEALVVLLGGAINATLAGYDRQLQQGGPRDTTRLMSDADDGDADLGEAATGGDDDGVATVEPETVDYEDFAELRRDLERFEAEIEDRTVHREELERDLRQYVRQQARRGHARGWGPYLVLLYGTAMTLGAFYFLSGGWAILAMLVVWLSTLGLYTLMVLVGVTAAAIGLPGRALGLLRKLRP
ncbi:hypothetical protein BRD09_00260 [Halobacteriales archaeon SW_10_68_16]|nr:MAG: hypothetical protein BRD09_00260 [Halobacteriales archaeon SW_10_68_16]